MKRKCKLERWVVFLIFYMTALQSFAQSTSTVQGTVVDESGESLIGVSVRIKSASIGTATDVNGNFTIQAEEGATLVLSYVGFKTKEVLVKGKKHMNITLESDLAQLDEVVVIAYGAQKKVTITGAVSNVGGKELLKTPTASLGNAIAGKLSGVSSVQYSSVPGADDPILRVRGVGSFNGADPLVLVDGVERSFSQIDPNEVEDISILKDASATAVFGVRGANGVILVTTKRGSVGKSKISVSTSFGIQKVESYPDFVDSYTWATLYNQAQLSDGTSESQLRFSQEAIDHFKKGDQPLLYPNTNWLDYVMKKSAPQSQHNVSVSGGNEKVRYFVSAGLLTQDGLFKSLSTDKNTNFSYKRYNYRANVDLTFNKHNELSVNIGGRMEDRYELAEGEQNVFAGLVNAPAFAGYGIDEQGRRIVANKSYVGDYANDGLI